MSKEKDDYKKIKYFLMGLNSYNRYLRRKLRLEVQEIFILNLCLQRQPKKLEIIKSVCDSVEADGVYTTNILKLAMYLSSLSKIPETELFVETATLQKLKPIGTLLAAVIPIIISAIELSKGITH